MINANGEKAPLKRLMSYAGAKRNLDALENAASVAGTRTEFDRFSGTLYCRMSFGRCLRLGTVLALMDCFGSGMAMPRVGGMRGSGPWFLSSCREAVAGPEDAVKKAIGMSCDYLKKLRRLCAERPDVMEEIASQRLEEMGEREFERLLGLVEVDSEGIATA